MTDAKKTIWLLLGTLALTACTGMPEGVEPVDGFEVDRYLGKWYEIARLDHRFERGLSEVSATYSRREDGGVHVINRGYNRDTGSWKEAIGKAYFVADPGIGRLKVSFFGPFYGGYNIIDLDKEGYSYSLVAGPSRNYFWILAREPAVDPAVLQRLPGCGERAGF